jgi:HK97 gp10 family phage protein
LAKNPLLVKVVGLKELENDFKKLGVNFPKSKVRQAANAGANLPLKKARQLAPKRTGELKKGIIKVEEKAWKLRKKMKKAVFQIYFDAAKNSIFQKSLNPQTQGSRGGQTRIPHAYYPISLEYGFHVAPGKRTKPQHFIRNAVEATQLPALQKVTDHLTQSINKLL